MTASMKFDTTELKRLIALIEDSGIRQELERFAERKDIAALVGQAIAENFANEGPGWRPLKGATIRMSIGKKTLAPIRKEVLQKMGLKSMKAAKKEGRAGDVNRAIDKKLERHERRFGGTEFSNRMILQKTGLLKKSASSPGYKGNIWRREGTKLVWGTDLVYAAVHNYGSPAKNIPQREFLVIRDKWAREINTYTVEQMLEVIKRKLGGR